MQQTAMEAFHQALAEIMVLTSQATQAMTSRQYVAAADGFSQALRKAKLELARCSTRTLASPIQTTLRVELGIEWGGEEGEGIPPYQQHTNIGDDQEAHPLVFRRPILLRLFEDEDHDDDSQRNTDVQLLQTICFGLILNLALCHHMQALLVDRQRGGEESNHLFKLSLNKTVMLYQLAGDMFSAVQERQSPLQLILLNNLGEVFLQAASLPQAIHCFQTLSTAVEWFWSVDQTNTTQNSADMESLAHRFYSQRNARFPIATTCAPIA